jgi:hypothetical protein
MRRFLAAVRETTLPAPVKDAAMANLSTFATNTCFRTADGKFRGFEGTNDSGGWRVTCHAWPERGFREPQADSGRFVDEPAQ